MKSLLFVFVVFASLAYGADSFLFDRLTLSQKPSDYASESDARTVDDSKLRKKIFEVWDEKSGVKKGEHLASLSLLNQDGYGENLLLYSRGQKKRLRDYTANLSIVNKNGIVIRNSDIRALPSSKPYFFNPQKAGEGFPFDYFQESKIYANTPVRALFATADEAFFYVSNYISGGWIDSRNIYFTTPPEEERLKNSKLFATIKDKTAVFGKNGVFLEKMAIGSFVYKDGEEFLGASNEGISKLIFDEDAFAPLPLEFSQRAVSSLADGMMNEPYGWGGMFDNRDCSMFLRDLYLPFGVYLPRNSKDQAKLHSKRYIDLSKLSEAKKSEYITQNATPFNTLLYLKGHILLYIGAREGEPLALHDMWGFAYNKNGEEKKYIIGKPVISTLYIGEKHDGFDSNKSIAVRLLGMRDIAPRF